MKPPLVLVLFVFLSSLSLIAQDQRKVDSLQALLKSAKHDTIRAEYYFKLAQQYWTTDPKKATEYANQTLVLSDRSNYKRGMADAYHVFASVKFDSGKKIESIELNKKALAIRREINDEEGIYASLFNMGFVYESLGDAEHSLECNFACITYYERIGALEDAAGIYHNISNTYAAGGNRAEAIKYLHKALNINRKVGRKDWQALNLLALASYHQEEGRIDEALKEYSEARELFEVTGEKQYSGMSLIGVGSILSLKGRYKESIDSLLKALAGFREINNRNGIAWSFNNLGSSYTLQRKFKEAALYLDSCLKICIELNSTQAMRNVYQRLYQLDSASGDFANAYKHYALYIAARDSVNNVDNIKTVASQHLRFDYTKKEEKAKAEQEKKDAVQSVTRNALIVGLGLVVLLALVLYNRFRLKHKANEIITAEKERSEKLLLNILPAEVAEELKTKGGADAKLFNDVTVLFTDFKGFTTISEQLTPQELVDELHTCFTAFDEIIDKYHIEKIKTIGDAYLAVCGLPLPNEKHAENIVIAALEIRDFMESRGEQLGNKTFKVRIGINSGSVVAGIVGVKKFAYDIWGDTVNTAARMEQNSEAGKINISQSTHDLVNEKFVCLYRGELEAKNKGMLKMYFVERGSV